MRALTLLLVLVACGAKFESANFAVHAPTDEIAARIAEAAEESRQVIATDWLGKELPRWTTLCEIHVLPGGHSPDGATTYRARYGATSGLRIDLSGPLTRILDSVLPHEMTHAVLATHFKNPLPRWADEGAATLAEAEPQRRRQAMIVRELVKSRHRLPLRHILSMRDYPHSQHEMMAIYCIGYSLSEFLVQSGGRPRYVEFLETADRIDWDQCIRLHYGFDGVEHLEKRWLEWLEGSRPAKAEGRWL